MAQIYDISFNPALDGNGEPYPGALLHTYIPGTTTNRATYTTTALSVANTNPLVADSAGRFGQMFADEGTLFDLVLTDADGGNSRTFSNVAAVGGTSNTLTKDFGANGRFEVYGNAGVIEIETGNPTGDNVGGSGRIGGWNLTQGDALAIDYSATNVSGTLAVAGAETVGGNLSITGNLAVTGDITSFGAGSAIDLVISSGTFSAVSEYEITLPSTFTAFKLYLRNVTSSAGGNFQSVLSFDGTTYKTGAADYGNNYGYLSPGVPAAAYNGTAAYMLFSSIPAAGSNYLSTADLLVSTGVGVETTVSGTVFGAASGSSFLSLVASQTNNKGYGQAKKIKLKMASGTMSGTYTLRGLSTF